MNAWNDLHIIELGLICLIKASWCVSALLTRGSRWRWMVALWMASGASFFLTVTWNLLHSSVPSMSAGPITEFELSIYAATHLMVFVLWLRLPNDPPKEHP